MNPPNRPPSQIHPPQQSPRGPRAMWRATLHRARRYPIWSAKAIAVSALLTLCPIAGLIFLVGHESLFRKLEITLGMVAGSLFLFLSVGLYKGVRVKKESIEAHRPSFSLGKWGGAGWNGLDLFAADGCGEAIGGIIVGILLAVLLAVLFALLVTVVWPLILLLVVAVFWIFNRAMRQVFRRSRTCKGNLGASLGYALFYSCLYTGWLFLVTWGAHRAFLKH